MRLIILSLLVFGLLLSGCFEPLAEDNQTNTTDDTVVPVVKNPSFTITSPTVSEVIYTTGDTYDVTLSLSTQNLVLKQPGGAAKSGEGHFKISIDNEPATIVTSKNYVLPSLALGEHTIKVELWKNDGTAYGISKQVTFTIAKEAPVEYEPVAYTVEIDGFSYDPSDITVKRTDTVTFVNVGSYPQSATCFINGEEEFDTGVLSPGASATITMDEVMSCEYYSVMYSFVKGTITVEPNDTD